MERLSKAEWYEDWFNSTFYHKLYFQRDEQEAESFIDRLVTHLNPQPHSTMLDVACGKGRHSRMLARHGFEVTGIDLAPQSIAEASQHEQENLHFFQHDMRLPAWVNYFDYVFNFFTSFGYFRTRREHDDAMRTIAQAVKKGGTVVFDYLNVHFVEEGLIHNEVRKIEETEYEIHRWHDHHHFYKRIIIRDPSLSTPMEHTEQVAKFSLGDFTDMLSFQKLQVTEVFGNYALQPYDVRKSQRMIILARK